MRNILRSVSVICFVTVLFTYTMHQTPSIELDMVAKIREEGFQRSQVMDLAGYMSDVLGARLTLSEDMKRAQAWAQKKMEDIGLVNVVAGEKIAPEFVQRKCQAAIVAQAMQRYFADAKMRQRMIMKLSKVKDRLGETGAAGKAAHLAASMIGNGKAL